MGHSLHLQGSVVGVAQEQPFVDKVKSIARRLVLVFILANLFLVDLSLLDAWRVAGETTQQQKEETVLPQTVTPLTFEEVCSTECKTQLQEYVAGLEQKESTPIVSQQSSVKEFYVPLGSGTNASSEWQDVSGAVASIDTTQYASLKTVTFEASVRIPSASQYVYVRLYNATDKHPVWDSEMSTYEPSKLLISKPIHLDAGNKTYQVQMKTQLKATAILDQARVHITIH